MPDRSRSHLEELRAVEERIAVRTARIDQLDAAARSSQAFSLPVTRGLLVVGWLSALTTAALGSGRLGGWTFDLTLVVAAGGLVLATGCFTLLLAWFARDHGRIDTPAERVLTMCARAGWHPFPSTSPTGGRPDAPPFSSPANRHPPSTSLGVPMLFAAALAAAAASVPLVGSAGLAFLALVLVSGLLWSIWAGRVAPPATVRVTALIVAAMAAVSVGGWVGGTSGAYLRGDRPVLRSWRAADTPSSPTRGQTYEELCGVESRWTSAKASPPIAHLRETWLSVGAVVAGCPGPVHDATSSRGIVTATGTCDGQLQSVGIANRNRGVLVLGQAAAVAETLVNAGSLRDVPTHLLVGGGDLYIIATAEGTLVLARRSMATSETGSTRSSTSCDASSAQTYSVLPPALSTLWLGAMRAQSGWLWPRPVISGSSRQGFVFVNQDSKVLARGSCDPKSGECQLALGGGVSYLNRQPSTDVSVAEILHYAPSP